MRIAIQESSFSTTMHARARVNFCSVSHCGAGEADSPLAVFGDEFDRCEAQRSTVSRLCIFGSRQMWRIDSTPRFGSRYESS